MNDPAFELTREDFEKVEADLLATGYLFEMSAVVSVTESPEKYKPIEGPAATGAHDTDEEGRPVVGTGDNVFRAKADVAGTARFVSNVETVMEMSPRACRRARSRSSTTRVARSQYVVVPCCCLVRLRIAPGLSLRLQGPQGLHCHQHRPRGSPVRHSRLRPRVRSGFHCCRRTSPGSLDPETGRGMVLMRAFFDEVTFNAPGNEVTLVKRRRVAGNLKIERHASHHSRLTLPCQPCSWSMTRPWTASSSPACWRRAVQLANRGGGQRRGGAGQADGASRPDRHRSGYAGNVGPRSGRPAHQEHPEIPVILMTGKGSEEIAVQALQAGAASYVPKGRLHQHLLTTVQDVLDMVREQHSHARLMDCLESGQFQFVLGNDPSLIPSLISHVQSLVSSVGLCGEASVIRVCIALEEALRNAMFHGNLELTSERRRRRRGRIPAIDRRAVAVRALHLAQARNHRRSDAHQWPLRHSRPRAGLRSHERLHRSHRS